MNYWLELDEAWLLTVNGWWTDFGDTFMWYVSWKITWIPVYVVILALLVRKYGWKQALVIALMVAPLILITDQVSSNFLKPYTERLRPCQEDELRPLLHLVRNKCGGSYGFVSSHAANFFALATYLGSFFALRWRIVAFGLAGMVGFSRIYLAVHYPGDVIGGMILGILAGIFILFIFHRLIAPRVHFT